MSRRILWLALLGLAAHWQAVYAQTITVPEESPPYTVISPTLTHELPDGAKVKYRWVGSDGISFGKDTQDNKRPYYTGRPGPYTLTLTAVWIEGDSPQLGIATATGRIGAPGPQPPPTPEPVPKTLAELAGKDAAALGRVYAELLRDVTADASYTVELFHLTHKNLLASQGLEDNGAAEAIAAKLAVETLDQLKAELEAIVKELGAPPVTPPAPTDPVTAVTYVYEKDDGAVPPAVHAGLSELNTATLRATSFEEDTTDSSGEVPEQYKAPLTAAREAGLPSLVVMAGANVRKVVKAPTTREQVLEAAR